ncbi:MAG: hypothetical protein U1A27_12870 [Phycisphaerae bacterium]
MDPAEILHSIQARDPQAVAALAVAVQANVVTLKVAWSKRRGILSELHEIRTPSPGAVREFRSALVDRHAVQQYDDDALALRTRQVWGQFTALCFTLGHDDPHAPPDFSIRSPDRSMRCPAHLHEKIGTVRRGLWRLRFEQRLRFDPTLRSGPGFQRDYEDALATPVLVFGQNVRICDNELLLLCACEFAGMLAALRWAADDRWTWDDPALMELDGSPVRPERE